LRIAPGATAEKIREAYDDLCLMYDPKRFCDLDEEFGLWPEENGTHQCRLSKASPGRRLRIPIIHRFQPGSTFCGEWFRAFRSLLV